MAQYRAPRTRIPEAFGQLASANALLEQRNQAAREQQTNKFANMVGTVAGVATLAYTGNPKLAALAYSGGSQIAGATRGREINPAAAVSIGAGISDEMASQEQLAAERQTLTDISAERDKALAGSYAEGTPERALAGARPEDRLLAGATKSRTPFQTFAQGIGVLDAVTPAGAPTEISFGRGTTLLTQTDRRGRVNVLGSERVEKGETKPPKGYIIWDEKGAKQIGTVATFEQAQQAQSKIPGSQISEIGTTPFRPDKDGDGSGSNMKEFQTFSPNAFDSNAYQRIAKTKGVKVDPQILKNLESGVVDLSTLGQQLNATPDEIEAAKFGAIEEELAGNRLAPESKAAARTYLKQQTAKRTDALIGKLQASVEAAGKEGQEIDFSDLQKQIQGGKYIDQKRAMGELNKLQGELETDSKNQEILFQRQLQRLPEEHRKDVDKASPGQRKAVLDQKLGQRQQKQLEAERYVESRKGKGFTDEATRKNAMKIMGNWFTEDEKQKILAASMKAAPLTASK